MLNPTVSDDAPLVERLARDIQEGVFGERAWLKQIDLQQRYGAKRLDVRRALDLLTVRRLIQHVPNRGYHVRGTDRECQEQLRSVRALLEVGAAADLMEHVTDEALAKLRALALGFESLLLTGTACQLRAADLAFHTALYDLCANRELVGLIDEVRTRATPAAAVQWLTRARMEQSMREHHEMVDALHGRDLGRLQNLIRSHVGTPQ